MTLRPRIAGLVFAACSLARCGTATPTAEVPPVEASSPAEGRPAGAAPQPVPSEPPVEESPARVPSGVPATAPRFAHCAISYANVELHRHTVTPPSGVPRPSTQTGHCHIEARCMARRAEDSPGDGFVSLVCKDGECTCHIEPRPELVPVVELHFPSECLTREVAHQLIRERCMKDMPFDPEPPTPDNPPVELHEQASRKRSWGRDADSGSTGTRRPPGNLGLGGASAVLPRLLQ